MCRSFELGLRSIIPIVSTQFFLRRKKERISYNVSYPISRIDFLLAHGDGAKVKICDRGGFDRRVALEPSTCSRGALRSHYLMVITGVERPIGREV